MTDKTYARSPQRGLFLCPEMHDQNGRQAEKVCFVQQ
ncbi:MAG: hypothetical protein ACJAVZ_001326 [Afipia broomeae]|jgi:hypothetical protein